LKTRIRGNHAYIVESRPGYFATAPAADREPAQQRIDGAQVAVKPVDVTLLAAVRRRSVGRSREGFPSASRRAIVYR
jgi:hypothetical protein